MGEGVAYITEIFALVIIASSSLPRRSKTNSAPGGHFERLYGEKRNFSGISAHSRDACIVVVGLENGGGARADVFPAFGNYAVVDSVGETIYLISKIGRTM